MITLAAVYRQLDESDDERWFVPRIIGAMEVHGVILCPANRLAPVATRAKISTAELEVRWEAHPLDE